MKFIFETKNINKRLYKRAIRYLIWDSLNKNSRLWKIFHDVTIKIRPMQKASEDRYFTKDGIAGYFGERELVLYILDSSGDIQFRTNMAMIGIETGHMVLAKAGFRDKVSLRHDDLGHNKAGTKLPYFVAEVHDRVHERKFFTLNFWFWDWKLRFAKRIKFVAVDIRDILL